MPSTGKSVSSPLSDASVGTWRGAVVAILLAVGLTYLFWFPLWHGGGLQGGDLYPYYFPQKQFLAESLRKGRIPLWNNLVGLGYPVLAESQTGALYPPHLLLYSVFDVNTAYNVNQLLHYVAAFLGMWMLSRSLGLSRAGSILAAVVYVYGWFPARICLEWAIIGGVYQPWMLWILVRFRQTGSGRFLTGIALLLGMHLLAGHYNLAFITLLLLTPLAFLPGFGDTSESKPASAQQNISGGLLLMAAVALGFTVAAVQLVPSWELKGLSQRAETGEKFAPGYGHLPPLAITQLVAPWFWHGADVDADQMLRDASLGTIPNETNKAEAWVYAGTIPVLLMLYGWLKFVTFEAGERRRIVLWSGVAVVSLIFATGWPIMFLSWAPGFSFFMGPGRYTILTTLAIAIVAATVLDSLLGWTVIMPPSSSARRGGHSPPYVYATVIAITVGDLWAASREYQFGAAPSFGRQVFYASLVTVTPIEFVRESTVKKVLDEEPRPARIYAPGPNVATLTGQSAIPVYLGLGPRLYVERPLRFDFQKENPTADEVQEIVASLYDLGVTHLLLEHPLDESRWPVKTVFVGHDPLINRVFGRLEPYWFYRLPDSPGRARIMPPEAGTIAEVRTDANEIAVTTELGAEAELILSELDYPGWQARIDGQPVEAMTLDGLRKVSVPAGRHTVSWMYVPWSFRAGLGLTFASLAASLLLPWILRRSRRQATGESGEKAAKPMGRSSNVPGAT